MSQDKAFIEIELVVSGLDRWLIGHGLKSVVMLMMERHGITRDEAVERLRELATLELEHRPETWRDRPPML